MKKIQPRPSIANIERIVAKHFNIAPQSLVTMPDTEATQIALDFSLVMARDLAQMTTTELMRRYKMLSRSAVVNRLYATYQRISDDKWAKCLYEELKIKICKAAQS